MGKIMINGEQYPSFVVKTGLDDSSIVKDKTWSSSKINEELEDVRGELDIIVEEANKNTSINDEVESLTTVWSSKKTSNELATKQENMSVRKVYARRNSSANKYILLSTIDMSKITYIGQPLRIKGVIGNMASDITNIDLVINARNGFVKKILSGTVTHKNFLTNDANIIITKSDDEKTAYVYLYCISTYGYIDAEIYLGSVHYSVPSTFDLVETMQGTEYTNLLDTNYVVIENVINDTTSSTTSTYSSSMIDSVLEKKLFAWSNSPSALLGFEAKSTHTIEEFMKALYAVSSSGSVTLWFSNSTSIDVKHNNTTVTLNGGSLIWNGTDINNAWQAMSVTYIPASGNKIYKIRYATDGDIKPLSQGIEVYGGISDSSTSENTTWSSSKIASEIDNAILVKDIIYQGAITANQRKILGNVGIHVDKIISISKIFGDTVEGWDYGVAQITNVGELVYMPTTTSESTFIQYKIAYRE